MGNRRRSAPRSGARRPGARRPGSRRHGTLSTRLLPPTPVLIRAATAGYLANVALGTAVRARVLDTSGYRWLHHALFLGTAALTATAVGAGLRRRAPQVALLAPAAIPLAALPYAGHRVHARVALTAAPWYAAAALTTLARTPRPARSGGR